MVASLPEPWGEARGDEDRAGYHLCWPRDLVMAAGGLLCLGLAESATRAAEFLRATQEADGHWAQNLWLDGRPNWTSHQVDEVSLPVLLVDLLRRELRWSAGQSLAYWPTIRRAVGYIVRNGPRYGRRPLGGIFTDFEYDPNATTVATPVAEVARLRRGVCQDFAHFQISCLRSMGLAARYVSGYLSTVPPPGVPRLIGCDATHAWVSAYCGAAGWVDLDPTNDVIPGNRHVLLAWGRDYDDVAPLKGVILGGGSHAVRVSVDVEPVE